MPDAAATTPIPDALLHRIGGYLAERPYREVAVLLGDLGAAIAAAGAPPVTPDPTTED